MPTFKFELSDADIADVVSFVRDKCCWDPENPPLNPQYRASPTPSVDRARTTCAAARGASCAQPVRSRRRCAEASRARRCN